MSSTEENIELALSFMRWSAFLMLDACRPVDAVLAL